MAWELTFDCPKDYNCVMFKTMDECLDQYKNFRYATCVDNVTTQFREGVWRTGNCKMCRLSSPSFYPSGDTHPGPNRVAAQIRPYTSEEIQEGLKTAATVAAVAGVAAVTSFVIYKIWQIAKKALNNRSKV